MAHDYDYDPVLTEEDIAQLKSYGYCNVGEGNIARVEQQQVSERLSREWKRCGLPGPRVNQQDGLRNEHVYRTHLAQKLHVGEEAAALFPESSKTLTYFIRMSAEERTWLKEKVEHVQENWAKTITIAKHDELAASERAAKYAAEAMF